MSMFYSLFHYSFNIFPKRDFWHEFLIKEAICSVAQFYAGPLMPFSFYASSHNTLTNSPSKSLNTSATASLQPTHLLSSVLQYL